jgi:hypothetical protein
MQSAQHHESHILDELREFAAFTTAEQRYIRCALEVASGRAEAAEHWARGPAEAATMRLQAEVYTAVHQIRSVVPSGLDATDSVALLAPLVAMSAFDLGQGKLSSFAAYRFLYERLIGPSVRPWLVSAFSAAATLPCMHPDLRAELFASLRCWQVAPAGWSSREPTFFPEWVEKVPVGACG